MPMNIATGHCKFNVTMKTSTIPQWISEQINGILARCQVIINDLDYHVWLRK